MLGGKHLVLAHVRGHKRITLRCPVDRANGLLWLDAFVPFLDVDLQAFLLAPALDLVPPFGKTFLLLLRALADLLFHQVQHLLQYTGYRSHDRHVRHHIL